MFYIYIIYSNKANKYYVGFSDDPVRRLSEHNNDDKLSFTKKNRPWILKAFFPVSKEKGTAVKIEKYIKKQKSRIFIEKLIKYKNDPDKLAQLVRVPIHRD